VPPSERVDEPVAVDAARHRDGGVDVAGGDLEGVGEGPRRIGVEERGRGRGAIAVRHAAAYRARRRRASVAGTTAAASPAAPTGRVVNAW
jgi:hypothetical protein